MDKKRVYIRKLGVDDGNAYRNLRLLSYQEASFAFSESYEDECKKTVSSFIEELTATGYPEEYFILGAFSESKELIGFVKFRRDQRSKARHKSMIHAMYVAAEYRKSGVGQELIHHLFEICNDMPGLEQIHLWVLYLNDQSAAPFYQSLGFTLQGPLVKKDLKVGLEYIDAGYMVKYF